MPFNAWNQGVTQLSIGLDSGILYVGNVQLGVSVGGLKFDPKKTMRNIPFDGQRSAIAGNDRVTKFDAEISGKFIQSDITAFLNYEAAASSSSGSSGNVINTLTVVNASTLIPVGSLLQNLRLIWKLGSNNYMQVRFYRAIVEKYTGTTKDNAEVEIDSTFMARLDLTVSGLTTDSPPYIIEELSSVP